MRIAIVGEVAPDTQAALAADHELVRVELPQAGDTVRGLAEAFRTLEANLSEGAPDAAVICGEGEDALAAAVTAVKLGLRTVMLGADEAPLAARVAHDALPASAPPGEIARRFAAGGAPTLGRP